MIIERTKSEALTRSSNGIDIDDLNDMANWLKYSELTQKSKTNQNDVNALVKQIKKGRWSAAKTNRTILE